MHGCNVFFQIIPAIIQKWPKDAPKFIDIQLDNAKPHIQDSDPHFRAAPNQNGFVMKLVQQPPNSPDTNVNDLGQFRAIQSLQVQTACKIIVELIKAVEKSFEELYAVTLDNVFLSLQDCMIEIMKVRGHNSYKLPHMGKAALRRADQLPHNLEVPAELVRQCIAHLLEMGCTEGLVRIARSLGMEV